ncbi:MAG: permease, partial [Bacteroidetes bacterium GWE2_41_25]
MEMSTSMLLILIAIGIVTGVLAGLLGIGGAIVMIPALVFLMGFNQHMAQGTSLAVMLPPIGIIAAYNYYKVGQVNLTYALILAACFLIGSYFGSKLALNLPQATLKKIFAVLL